MLRRLSVDAHCDDVDNCQAVWGDDEHLDDLVIVGQAVPPGTVPLASGEVAVRIHRRVVAAARI